MFVDLLFNILAAILILRKLFAKSSIDQPYKFELSIGDE
jgi:hypothetical protein